MKTHNRIFFTIGIVFLFIGLGTNSAFSNNLSNNRGQPSEVFVDDDFNVSTPGWGYDHFDNIQSGIDNVSNYGIIHVYEGYYDVFNIEGRTDIIIESDGTTKPIIQGSQNVIDYTLAPPSNIKCVIFVDNSANIILRGVNIQGVGLTGRSYAVFYNGSTGLIDESNISPNQRGNMNSIAIRAQLFSDLSVENCTILNYGRIGIYCRSGTNMNIYNNSIYGQIYTDIDGDYVSYGIEVEDLIAASHATIRYNEITNHDHTGNPTWSSAAIIIDAWRYYQVTPDKCSAIVEYNNIHSNMLGLQIVPNSNINVNFNKIINNRDYGAVSDPYWDGNNYIYVDLKATNNWWGEETGPYNPNSNPSGTGNEVTDYVIFDPWLDDYLPRIEITEPKEAFIYFNFVDIIEFKIPFFTTFIIGKNDVEAMVTKGIYDIVKVEFYVDDTLKFSTTDEPYRWTWNEITGFFPYILKAVVYDAKGNTRWDKLDVWKTQSFVS